jgi:hypothetical protein
MLLPLCFQGFYQLCSSKLGEKRGWGCGSKSRARPWIQYPVERGREIERKREYKQYKS